VVCVCLGGREGGSMAVWLRGAGVVGGKGSGWRCCVCGVVGGARREKKRYNEKRRPRKSKTMLSKKRNINNKDNNHPRKNNEHPTPSAAKAIMANK